MAGTKFGGLKASQTNKKKYGPDFYREIGRKGGLAGNTGGFATVNHRGEHILAKLAGAKGGRNSKRGPSRDRVARVEQAKSLRKQGFKIKEIADKIGVTEGTIINYLKGEK